MEDPMAKRTPWQIAAEIEQQERARRHARSQEQQQGAEKLQELLAMLEGIEGSYGATFGLATEPELCVQGKIGGKVVVAWTRDGGTLLGTLAGQGVQHRRPMAVEAFRDTVALIVRRRAA